ncbi:MAG: hypothetical protein QNL04_05925, partial [SAR324 cluster bacterium]|nr:hypothetical protein [SAR324 cluster bacterium]
VSLKEGGPFVSEELKIVKEAEVKKVKVNNVTEIQPLIKERKHAEETYKEDLVREIRKLLSKRNQGVTVGQLCASFGLNRRLAEDLENPRVTLDSIHIGDLEEMRNTIQEVYNEQSAISY